MGVLEEDVERGWTRCKQRTGLKAKEDSRLWAEGDPALVNGVYIVVVVMVGGRVLMGNQRKISSVLTSCL